MKFVHLNAETIGFGRLAFNQYKSATMCGRSAENYEAGMCRRTGLSVVPGAIIACIEQGMIEENEIVNAVARVSLCRRSTVSDVLFALCGTDPDLNLWSATGRGDFEANNTSRANVILIA